jgi:hypothetical protein
VIAPKALESPESPFGGHSLLNRCPPKGLSGLSRKRESPESLRLSIFIYRFYMYIYINIYV